MRIASYFYINVIRLKSIDKLVWLIAAHLTDGILEHDVLVEKIVDRLFSLCVVVHRTLEEEAQEPLYTIAPGTCGEIAQQGEVKQQRSCEDRVSAEEVDLDLHGVAHPTENIDIVPTFLIVVAGRIVVDAHLVVDVAIEVGLIFLSQDGLQRRELRHLLGVEVGRLVEHQTITVAQDVG